MLTTTVVPNKTKLSRYHNNGGRWKEIQGRKKIFRHCRPTEVLTAMTLYEDNKKKVTIFYLGRILY